MHVALWVLAATSFIGAMVCMLRPRFATVSPANAHAAAPPSSRDPGAELEVERVLSR